MKGRQRQFSRKQWGQAIQLAAQRIGYPRRGPVGCAANVERRRRTLELVRKARELLLAGEV